MSVDSQTLYSQLPSVDTLLRDETFQPLLENYGAQLVTQTLRRLQQQARTAFAFCNSFPHGVKTGLSQSIISFRSAKKTHSSRFLI